MKGFGFFTKGRIPKGERGYLAEEKKRRGLITLLAFAVPLFIFFTSWAYFHSRETVWTVIAILGCLPACRSLVGLIMVFPRKPMDPGLYERIRERQGRLCMAFELYMTFYEKSAYLDALAVCGQNVAVLSTDPGVDCSYMAGKAREVLQGNGYRASVHVFQREKDFLERLSSLNEHYDSLEGEAKPVKDSRYEGLSRDEAVREILLSLCL